MLKWFRQAKLTHPEIVTDDPLATIRVNSAGLDHREIYAVSRVNPLFYDYDEEGGDRDGTKSRRNTDSPEKSGSSGYESNRGGNSSSDGDTVSSEPRRTTRLRKDAVTVVEQNVGFVKSILVAVRGDVTSSAKTKATTLSPIPEGTVDYCIPRPVWPPKDRRRRHATPSPRGDASPGGDDAVLLFTRLSYSQLPTLPLPRVTTRSSTPQNERIVRNNTISQSVSRRDDDFDNNQSENIFRDLSNTIRLVLERNLHASQEELLESLSHTINENIAQLQRTSMETCSEDTLRRLSFSLSHSDPVLRMTRALSNSTGSSGGSSVQRALLKGSDVSGGSPVTSDSEVATRVPSDSTGSSGGSSMQRALLKESPVPRSSSSSASSSGCSDVTHLPASTSSSRLSQPVFSHEDMGSMTNSTRNALMYGGTVCRMKGASSVSGSSGYEKLLNSRNVNQTNKSERSFRNVDSIEDQSLWQTFYGPGVTAGDVKLKSTSEPLYRWPTHHPDFTLDMPTAERLMRKIKAAKKRRFWCRLVTSLLGLVFFVLSVMVVSLVLTRGKRVFGSL